MSFALNLDKLFKAIDYDICDNLRETVGYKINAKIQSYTDAKPWWNARERVTEPVRQAIPISSISSKTSNYEF